MLGVRPTAISTASASMASSTMPVCSWPSARSRRTRTQPSAARSASSTGSIPAGVHPVRRSHRRPAIFVNVVDTDMSCCLSSRWPRLTWTTSVPSPAKTEANSQAMNPPPTTSSRRGSRSIRITVSEVCTDGRSRPGIAGRVGRDPAATTTWSAVISRPEAVRTRRGPTKRTSSWITLV